MTTDTDPDDYPVAQPYHPAALTIIGAAPNTLAAVVETLISTVELVSGDRDECEMKHRGWVLEALRRGRDWTEAVDYNDAGQWAYDADDWEWRANVAAACWSAVQAIRDAVGLEVFARLVD